MRGIVDSGSWGIEQALVKELELAEAANNEAELLAVEMQVSKRSAPAVATTDSSTGPFQRLQSWAARAKSWAETLNTLWAAAVAVGTVVIAIATVVNL